MTSAFARTAIRIRTQQIRFDDFLLLVACLACIAATVLQNVGADTLYQMILFDRSMVKDIPKEVINAGMSKIQRTTYSFAIVVWITIFSVKFSYLAFFRHLIDRQRALIVYWRVIVVMTTLAFILNVCGPFISCSEFGNRAYRCTDPSYDRRVLTGESFTNAFDIFTDLLLTSIPLILLHKVKIKLRQKIGLGSFLCLSFFMIVIVIIRLTQIRSKVWEIWAVFWTQIEACFAIMMLSTTAFRQLFISRNTPTLGQPKPKLSDTYRRYLSRWPKKSTSSDGSDEAQVSVSIPGAKLTGLQSFIRGPSKYPHTTDLLDRLDGDKQGLKDDNVIIRHDLEVHSDRSHNVSATSPYHVKDVADMILSTTYPSDHTQKASSRFTIAKAYEAYFDAKMIKS